MLINFPYIQRDTSIHRLDPRAKLVFLFLFSLAAAQTSNFWFILAGLIGAAFYYYLAHLKWNETKRAWYFIIALNTMIVVFNYFLVATCEHQVRSISLMKHYGSQSMIAPLRTVMVKRPDEAFAVDDPLAWHYTARPILSIARQEHDALVALLQKGGAEVIYHDESQDKHADAIFVFDPALVTDQGAIILSMGKAQRRGEEEVMARRLEAMGIPLLYTLHGKALAEGGDLLWLDHDTLAVGLGFRTNAEGLRQLREALTSIDVTVMPVELPYYSGPEACLHLLSLISIVDQRLAVVYPSLLSVPFWQELQQRGFRLIEVPAREFTTMAPNVLALAPGKCLMLEGNPITQRRLEEAGCEVVTYKGSEISLKAEGGPTCLTRPIWREGS